MTPVIDERGRIFGRLNLIDAFLLAFLCMVIPLGYGAWWVFRMPNPEVAHVEPRVLREGESYRVTVRGRYFRLWLRAYADDVPVGLLVQSPERAELVVQGDDLHAGVYDLILYDESREVTRARDALRVIGAPE